jgi:hypothetical protein
MLQQEYGADSCGQFADSSADSCMASQPLLRTVRIVFQKSYVRMRMHARLNKRFSLKLSELSAKPTSTAYNYPQTLRFNCPQLSAGGRP